MTAYEVNVVNYYVLTHMNLFGELKNKDNRDEVNLKSASNLNGNLNCSKELEHYAS